jgi:chitinase
MSINVRYMDFKSDCRLGNQLYFAISAYKYQKALGTKVNQSVNEELKPLYDVLNIQNYVVGHKTVSWLDLKNKIATGSNMMCQDFGLCYDEKLLNEFISDTILKSDIAKQTVPSESVCV